MRVVSDHTPALVASAQRPGLVARINSEHIGLVWESSPLYNDVGYNYALGWKVKCPTVQSARNVWARSNRGTVLVPALSLAITDASRPKDNKVVCSEDELDWSDSTVRHATPDEAGE